MNSNLKRSANINIPYYEEDLLHKDCSLQLTRILKQGHIQVCSFTCLWVHTPYY